MIARDGLPFILAPLLAALGVLLAGFWAVAVLLAMVALLMAFFFRDPRRTPPTEPDTIVAPADGRVTRIERLDPRDDRSPIVVSIFLSVLDVHINRAPIAGRISKVAYTRGRFMIATRDEASVVNEQNALTITGERVTVVCKQIAGVLARRIVCWKRAGDAVAQGERFGLIKFSSRTDLVLPPEVEVVVRKGERVRGGMSVVGRIRR